MIIWIDYIISQKWMFLINYSKRSEDITFRHDTEHNNFVITATTSKIKINSIQLYENQTSFKNISVLKKLYMTKVMKVSSVTVPFWCYWLYFVKTFVYWIWMGYLQSLLSNWTHDLSATSTKFYSSQKSFEIYFFLYWQEHLFVKASQSYCLLPFWINMFLLKYLTLRK